jgi:hypothetical protein
VPYPVRFEADYAEQRSRLTVFFRLILLIPVAIAVFFFAIVASVAVIIAWFAIVFTARYPGGLYEFMAGYTRFITRAGGYALLLCDPYPPFSASGDPAYPIRLEFAGPLARYSRWKTFFRFILAIPILIMRYIVSLALEIGAVVAWFVILIMGRLPRDLFELMALGVSWIARSDAYVLLLTETYPPIEEWQSSAPQAEPPAELGPPSDETLTAVVAAEPALEATRQSAAETPAAAEAATPAANEAAEAATPAADEAAEAATPAADEAAEAATPAADEAADEPAPETEAQAPSDDAQQ